MKPTIVSLFVAAVAAGCSYGMTAERFSPSRDPAGVMVTITAGGVVLQGELIELRQDDLILVTSRVGQSDAGTVRRVPYPAITFSSFAQLGDQFSIRNGQAPAGAVRERLRLVSRFPYGMSPAVLSSMLKAHRQTELAGIQP